VSRARLEAFSDGVLAVAITLLALDLAVPAPGPGHPSLLAQLGDRWPAFVAYLISFFTVGIIWVNHHARVADIAKVDRTLLFLNLILLLFVVAIPFATSTMAEYLTAGGDDARYSMVLYAGVFQGMGLAFAAIFEWSLKEGRLHHPIPMELRPLVRLRFSIGAVAYVAAIIMAFFSPLISLTIIGLVAVYYIFEQGPRRLRELQQR